MDDEAMVGNVLVSSLTNKKGGKIGTLIGGGKRSDSKSMLVVPMSLYSSSTSFQLPENNDDLENDNFDSDSDSDSDDDDGDQKEDEETSNQMVDDDIYDSLLGLMEETPDSTFVSQVEPSNVSMIVEEIETPPSVYKYASLGKSRKHHTADKSHDASKGKKHSKKHAFKENKAKKSETKVHNLTKKKNSKKTKRKGTKKHEGFLQGFF